MKSYFKYKKIFAGLFVIVFSMCVYAQEATVNMSLTEYEGLKKEKEALEVLTAARADTIADLKNQLSRKTVEADSLKKAIKQKDVEVKKVAAARKTLTDSIADLEKRIEKMQAEIASLDMVKLRYANGRLELPYNAEKINEAISLFNSVSNPQLKEDYKDLLTCLQGYSSAIVEVKGVIDEVQYKGTPLNKFDVDAFAAWKTSAQKRIKGYKDKTKNQKFKVIYLENIVEEANKRIENSKTPESMPDFQDLMIRLNL